MLIDWFTVAAQIVNFLLLVWLLQRYLYKPVLAAIDTREKQIAARLDEAARRETQAELVRTRYESQSAAAESERESLMRAAMDTAAAERERLLDSARREASDTRQHLLAAVAAEEDELQRRFRTRAIEEVAAIARKTLQDLANVKLEECIVDVFVARVRSLGKGSSEPAATPSDTSTEAMVRSGFELSEAQRATLEDLVRGRFGVHTTVRFETNPTLLCGIELAVDGVKLSWNIEDYLRSLIALTDEPAKAPALGDATPTAV